MQWKHFVPGYDTWFNENYVKKWGEVNNTNVTVDHVGVGEIKARAKSEVEARRGHDIVLFIEPPSIYEDHVIDHREIYEECGRRYGRAADFALRSTRNPHTGKYFGFCPHYLPAVSTYRKDLWDGVGGVPDSWAKVLTGGRQIRLLQDKPVGLSLAAEQNCQYTLRAIMYSFGASEQDAEGHPALKTKAALETMKYVKALYDEAMPKDVISWDAASNNRYMLNDEGCFTLDTLSIARASENLKLPIKEKLRLLPTPEGPAARIGPSFGFLIYVIWSFADNIQGAQQFLVDYTANLRAGLLESGFQNMPTFPNTVPDLSSLVSSSKGAAIPDQYALLANAPGWTTNIGYPGYAGPAIAEVYDNGLIPKMFAQVATGRSTAEDALDEVDTELRQIVQKWKERGKV